jgi:hypothetical protein
LKSGTVACIRKLGSADFNLRSNSPTIIRVAFSVACIVSAALSRTVLTSQILKAQLGCIGQPKSDEAGKTLEWSVDELNASLLSYVRFAQERAGR